jgi:pimeloyl-ACP methyl ester carboxylesterase
MMAGMSDEAAPGDSPEVGTTIQTCGYATNVLVWGDPSAEPTVLLVHGSGPGATAYGAWAWLVPALRDAGFAVVAPDLVGFGWTQRTDGFDYTLDAWVDQLCAVLDDIGLTSVMLVGNSLGGAIALSLAGRESQGTRRIQRIVVMGTVGSPHAITPALELVWGYEPSAEAMEALLRAMPFDPSVITPALLDGRVEASLRPGWQASFRAMFPHPLQGALDAMTVAPEVLARIDAPVLLLHGREDPVIPAEGSWRIAQVLPDAELRVYPQLGHFPSVECPQRYAEAVTGFLSRT